MTKSSSNLDILRSLAVGFVLLAHLWQFFGSHLLFGRIEIHHHLGLYGVILFFVHTSLVLMFSLERQITETGWHHWLRNFYLRRIFRIYPLSVITVALVWLLDLPVGRLLAYGFQDRTLGGPELLANFLLLQNFFKDADLLGVLWTLPIELQMYLLLPAFYLLITRIRNALGIIVTLASLSALTLLADPILTQWNSQLNWLQIPTLWKYVPCFLPGILCFWIWRNYRRPLFPWWVLPLTLFALAVLKLKSYSLESNFAICLVVGLLLPFLQEPRSSWVQKLSATIARYSYGIYLLHIPAMYLSFGLLSDLGWIVSWLAFSLNLWILCYMAFHWVEQPMIRYGRTLTTLKT